MKKLITISALMATAGFFVGWYTAPPLFAWFVAALEGFFRVPDPASWVPVYFRFALGVAPLFAIQVGAPQIANARAPLAPTIVIFLVIGITSSLAAAIVWHWMIGESRREFLLYGFMLPPTPRDLPCLSISLVGVVASSCAALLYRWRWWLHRFYDEIPPVRPRYDY